MKNRVRPFWLKITVLVFASTLMSAFVVFRGQRVGKLNAASPSSSAPAPEVVDSPIVMKFDTTGHEHWGVPVEQIVINPIGERGASERTFLGSSKSLSPVVPPQRDAVMEATERTWKQWRDSVNRAEAMQTLVHDRYARGEHRMITLDSLQRRVQRYYLPSSKSIQLHTFQKKESEYLDSLLNAFIK